jgi:gamma-glutamyltranspeptidase / glutathione hydrolase
MASETPTGAPKDIDAHPFGKPVPAPPQPHRPCVMATTHAVAAGHPLAAQAALQVLEAGGNAIDAGVAAGLCTAVLESPIVGFAGVAPVVFYLADRAEVLTTSGVGPWPAAASCEHFHKRHGGRIPKGVDRTVVPGAPFTWITLLERYGTMSFGDVAAAAIHLARRGFPMFPYMAHIIKTSDEVFAEWPSSRAMYMPQGRAPEVGEIFVQDDLGRSMQFLADEERAHRRRGRIAGLRAARDAFYVGDIARTICDFYRESDGLLTRADMAAIEIPVEPPAHARFRGLEVFTGGPWGQGPSLLQVLGLIDGFDLQALGHNSPAYIHVITEAVKLAAADREAWFGDPRFVEVPLAALLSDGYLAERRAMIRADEAWPDMPPPGRVEGGKPWRAAAEGGAGRVPPLDRQDGAYATSHLCVVDKWGNAFSSTPSDGARHGPVVPGTGLVPSGRGATAWTDPRHPNCVAPGKRPRMVMEAALALVPGHKVIPFGSPGSDVQLQAMLQTLLNVHVFGMDPQSAVEAPRFASYSFPHSFQPHASHPGRLNLERPVGEATAGALAAKGHRIDWWPERVWMAGSTCMIVADLDSGVLLAGADPRRSAYAVGF